MSEDDNVVNFQEAKSKVKPEDKKPKKGQDLIQDEIIWMLYRDDRTMIPHELRDFPYQYITVSARDIDRPTIWKVNQINNTARQISKESVAGEISEWFVNQKKLSDGKFPYSLTNTAAREIVEAWLFSREPKRTTAPKAVGYLTDPETVVHRLPFDPDMNVKTMDDLEWSAPMWHELLSRMVTNRDAFCTRVGSILHDCDRKQAVWVSGPKDSGKSQIEGLLAWFMGGFDGAYQTVSEMDLDNNWWTGNLPGKRVVTFEEAAKSFLNSNQFKAFTGSTRHSIVSKGIQPVSAEINPLFFFFSNDHPGCHDKPEIVERIIYCRMEAFKGQKMIDGAYQQALRDEGAAFFGYCEGMFMWHGPGRINCQMDELVNAVDFANEQFFAPFWKNFELNEESWVLKSDLTRIIDLHFQDRGMRAHVLSQWMAKFGLIPERCKKRTSHCYDKVALKGIRIKSFT